MLPPFVYAAIAGFALSIGTGIIGYSKGYSHGQKLVEARYSKVAAKVKGKMDNAIIPKSDEDVLDDLRNHKF